MKKETIGTILAVFAAIISGVSIPANKIFVVNMDPIVFTAVRSIIIGSIFLLISFCLSKKYKKKRKAVSWKYMAAIAIIGGAAAFLLFFSGLKMTTAGRAAFLHKTLPLYVAILAFFFLKEKITRKYLGAMLLMVVGTVAIYATTITPTDLWTNPQLGDALIISAAFLWAVENVIAKKAMKEGETNWFVSFSRMFFGGVILFGAGILLGRLDAFGSLTAAQLVNISISTMLLLGYVLFYYWSLKLINVSKASVMLLLAPVMSLMIGVIFLGESAPFTQLTGSAFILIGAYIMASLKSEERGV